MWLTGQRPAAHTWVSVLLAVAGAAIIGAGDVGRDGSTLGNLLAVAGAVAMAGYLMLAREAQRRLAYLPYVALAYSSAAAVLWVAVIASRTSWHGFGTQTWVAVAAMAFVSQLVGHGGYNWSLRHLPPTFVSVALTGEPVIAAGLAWWLLGEPVTAGTVLGGGLVLAAILVAARSRP
jgi:drug/metabolite transporter (DMT)-like permease